MEPFEYELQARAMAMNFARDYLSILIGNEIVDAEQMTPEGTVNIASVFFSFLYPQEKPKISVVK